MRSKEPLLSVIVPTRNECANIKPLLYALRTSLLGIATEIIIVDDSDDETPMLVERAAKQSTDALRVRLIHRDAGPERAGGLATAVSLGMSLACAKYVAVIDADLQHPPERLRVLFEEAIATDADIVMATRYRDGGSYEGLDGFSRRFFSIGLKWVAKVVFPDQLMRVSDPLGGFFLVRRSMLQGVTLRPIGYKISLEILLRCKWARLVEVPYQFRARAAGQSKADLKQGIWVLQHMARLVCEVPSAARFWKFCLVGASGVLVNFVLFWLALQAGLSQWFAWFAVTEVAVLTNFTLNSALTWSDVRVARDGWLKRALRYHGAVAPSLAINFIVFVLALIYHQRPLVAQMIGVTAGLLISYVLASRMVFTPAEEICETEPAPAGMARLDIEQDEPILASGVSQRSA